MAERVALVVPRCAHDALGGAEALALSVAHELAGTYDVEMLTTCANDYWSWENAYPEGRSEIEGIAVERFAVDRPRNLAEFNRLSRRVRYRMGSTSIEEQEQWMRAQGPYAPGLFNALATRRHDLAIFFTYLYATTYFGLPLVAERAILLPLAHDEWPFYFPMWRPFFEKVRAPIFASPEERELVQRRFRELPIAGPVIHPAMRARGAIVPQVPDGLPERYLLYVGRIDGAKGVTELCERFESYVQRNPASPWHLLLAGPGSFERAASERIRYLGVVDEATKAGLLERAGIFVMPSYHESLCIALLEAWAHGAPALVNGWNPVLVGQCRRSNGGVWYRDQASFDAALDALDAPTRAALGRQGAAYVARTYTGDAIAAVARARTSLGKVRR
ncbi:MAG: glycosyltransferase family 4 protein [Candidatus Baltobacteraceae bacterium]